MEMALSDSKRHTQDQAASEYVISKDVFFELAGWNETRPLGLGSSRYVSRSFALALSLQRQSLQHCLGALFEAFGLAGALLPA